MQKVNLFPFSRSHSDNLDGFELKNLVNLEIWLLWSRTRPRVRKRKPERKLDLRLDIFWEICS